MTQDIKRAKVEVIFEDSCPCQGQTDANNCKSCDKKGCYTSAGTNNSGGSYINQVPDIQFENTKMEYKGITDSLQAISNELDQQNEIFKANKSENEAQSKEAKAIIRRQREDIRNFFDKLEKEMEAKVNKATEDNIKRQELVQEIQNNLQASMSDLQKTQKPDQKLSGMKTLKENLAKLKTENTIGHYTYQPSLQLQDMMQTVKEFGTLIQADPAKGMEHPDGKPMEAMEAIADSNQKVSGSTLTVDETNAHNNENTNAKLEHPVAISARTKDDEQQCTITGVCSLPDGFLALVDYGNHCVKMIDVNHNKTVSTVAMESDPHDITKVTDNVVAVTQFYKRQIQFLTVSETKQLTLSAVLETSSPCYGILYSQENITVTHKNKLEVLDMKGKILKSFTKDSAGNQLFSHAKYLTQSPDCTTIYVSDYNNNTVTSLTTDGKVKAVYKDSDLQMPFGLAVDSVGYVYVCGYNSNNIFKMAADLSGGRAVLDASNGVVMPQSIAYCAEQNSLYVGMWCNDTIRIYQL